MSIEIRPVDLAAYDAISGAFAEEDLSEVATLCKQADTRLDTAVLRLWPRAGIVSESETLWRGAVRSMFRSFARYSPRQRRDTLEEWGEELALHIAIVLAMPFFQSRYLVVGADKRMDDPSLSFASADALEALARNKLADPAGSNVVHVEWPRPLSLVVLGAMDGGLLQELTREHRLQPLLKVVESESGPLQLFGTEKVLKAPQIAEVIRIATPCVDGIGGFAQHVGREFLGMLEAAIDRSGGVMISELGT